MVPLSGLRTPVRTGELLHPARAGPTATTTGSIPHKADQGTKSCPETIAATGIKNETKHGTQTRKGTILLPTERRNETELLHNDALPTGEILRNRSKIDEKQPSVELTMSPEFKFTSLKSHPIDPLNIHPDRTLFQSLEIPKTIQVLRNQNQSSLLKPASIILRKT